MKNKKLYKQEYNKKYRELHKKDISDYMKEYMRKDRLKNPSKHIERNKVWRQKNKEKVRLYSKKRNATPECRYSDYKSRAKKKGREFELSFDEFVSLLNGKCYYCDTNWKIGVDRKDNNVGYTKPNSVSCCWSCNKFKRSTNYEEFISNCIKIANHSKSKD